LIAGCGFTRGVRGSAELAFERQGTRTVLTRSRVQAPMAFVRPFDLPGGGLLVQLVSLGPGLCGGDDIRLNVTAGSGTRVVVTTTAATRVMTMDPGQRAEQHVVLRARADAVLEYYPCLTIPYPGSALRQTIVAEASDGARLAVLECWAMGRAARSEYLEFRSLASRTTVSVDGAVKYVDAVRLEPSDAELTGAGILAGRRYMAAGVWQGLTLGRPADADADVHAADLLFAFAESAPGLAYLRALARDGRVMEEALRQSVERVARCWRLPHVRMDRFHN
jgi:urease accessory protein